MIMRHCQLKGTETDSLNLNHYVSSLLYRVKEVLEPILGKNKISAQTVSNISRQLTKYMVS